MLSVPSLQFFCGFHSDSLPIEDVSVCVTVYCFCEMSFSSLQWGLVNSNNVDVYKKKKTQPTQQTRVDLSFVNAVAGFTFTTVIFIAS
jgi:hypothetical protein